MLVFISRDLLLLPLISRFQYLKICSLSFFWEQIVNILLIPAISNLLAQANEENKEKLTTE